MADVPIKVKYDGEQAKAWISELVSALKVAGVAFTAGTIVNELKKCYMGFLEDEEASARFTRSLTTLGASSDTIKTAMDRLSYSVTKLGQDEGSVISAMNALVLKSGDAEAAIADFSLVQDVAAKFGMDLGSATDVVANAMSGQFRQLGALLPYMKEWAKAHTDLAGTAEGATIALTELYRIAGGEAESGSEGALGQIRRVKTIFSEMGDEVGRMLTGSAESATSWKSIADEAERVLKAMENMKGLPVVQLLLSLPQFPGAVSATLRNQWDIIRNKGGHKDPVMDFNTDPAYMQGNPDWAGPKSVPTPTRPGRTYGGGKQGTTDSVDWRNTWQGPEMDDWMKERVRWGMSSSGDSASYMDAFIGDIDSAKKKVNDFFADMKKKKDDALAPITATLTDMFIIAFDGINVGWKKMVENMRDYISRRLIAWVANRLAELFSPIVGAAMGSIGKTLGLVFSTGSSKSFGAEKSFSYSGALSG